MATSPRPLLTLIDGSAYIFRAYHAIRSELSTSAGLPTRAVFGFTRMLLKSLREASPTHVAVVWDRDGRAFRTKIDPEYKANRSETPDDLKVQFPYIRKVVDALKVANVEKEGWEADDVIATLTHQAVEAGFEVVIVTGDKDFSQLVGEHVRLYDGMQDKWTGPEEVEARWGVPAEKFIELQSLLGDSSDNIPGIPGVGPKTGADLISKFGDLDGVIAATERGEVSRKKIAAAILESKERLAKNHELVRLRHDLALDQGPKDLEKVPPNPAEVRTLFQELEFYGLLRELPAVFEELGVEVGEEEEQATAPGGFAIPETEIVTDAAAFEALLERIRKAEKVGLRLAPPQEAVHLEGPAGIAVAIPGEASAYVPLAHEGLFEERLGDPSVLLEQIADALGDTPWFGVHTKRDLILLEGEGIELPIPSGDAELAAYLLNPARRTFEIADLAREKLGAELQEYSAIAGAGKERRPFRTLGPEVAGRWLAQSVACAIAVEEGLRAELEEAGLEKLYLEMELPITGLLATMENLGVLLDVEALHTLGAEIDGKLQSVLTACREAAGRDVNVASPKQLAQLLFEELELPVIKRTKTGPSTDHEVLEKLSEHHPLPKLILEHRSLAKLKGTYVDALPLLVARDGRLHTTFDQSGTATGRLASSNPNLMNIPIRTEMGRRIRAAFIAAPGHLLLSADYSQIELRILAHVSGDPVLSQALRDGADVHRRTASEVFGVGEADVTSEQREIAKMVNYAVAYGLSAFGLSSRLDIPGAEASQIIKRYFERYAGIKGWIDGILEQAKKEGYVASIDGRRRHLPDLKSRNHPLRQAAERAAINMPIQGTAADIMKRAMLLVSEDLAKAKSKAKMLLQVHDELVLEVPEAEVETVEKIVCAGMERAADLDVPLVVEAQSGKSWDK